jgi:hypothetical protein
MHSPFCFQSWTPKIVSVALQTLDKKIGGRRQDANPGPPAREKLPLFPVVLPYSQKEVCNRFAANLLYQGQQRHNDAQARVRSWKFRFGTFSGRSGDRDGISASFKSNFLRTVIEWRRTSAEESF